MKKIKNLRRKIVAAGTTGALLAGAGAIAYFVATGATQGDVAGGSIEITAEATGLNNQPLYPVAESGNDNDDEFTQEDFLDAEDASDMGKLTVTANQSVELDVVLSSLTAEDSKDEDGRPQYEDLYLGLCDDASTNDYTADCYFSSVKDLVDGTATDLYQRTMTDAFEARIFVWLASNGPQEQGVETTLTFNVDAQTTGIFGPDRVDSDGDGVNDDIDQCPGQDDTVDTDGDGTPDCADGSEYGSEGEIGTPELAGMLSGEGDGVVAHFQATNGNLSGAEPVITRDGTSGADLAITVYALDGDAQKGEGNGGEAWGLLPNTDVRFEIRQRDSEGDYVYPAGPADEPGKFYGRTDANGVLNVDLDVFELQEDAVTQMWVDVAESGYTNAHSYLNMAKDLLLEQQTDADTLTIADAIDGERNPLADEPFVELRDPILAGLGQIDEGVAEAFEPMFKREGTWTPVYVQ